MTESKTILLLPEWFFKRQICVSVIIFLVSPVTLLITGLHTQNNSIIKYTGSVLIMMIVSMLYPYSRYAVQKIIDTWYGNERVVYDGSVHATLGRKYEKMVVSIIFMPVLGPACLVLLLLARWRCKENKSTSECDEG